MSRVRQLWRSLRAKRGFNVDEAPAYWQRYVRALPHIPAADTPVDSLRFVALDTETTGLDHARDHVVTFGAVSVVDNAIDVAGAVAYHIRGQLPSDADSIEIHGVLNAELEGGISEARFVELLVEYVAQGVIVGYRPGFDMAILNRLVLAHTGGRLVNPTLDVFALGMRVDYPLKPPFVNPENYRLDVLCDRYGIEQPGRHTAIGDAYATAILFMKLLHRLREGGVETLADLRRRYL